MVTVEMKDKVLRYLIEHANDSALSFDKNKLAKRHSMGNLQLADILKDLSNRSLINTSVIADTSGTRCTITASGYKFFKAGGYKVSEEITPENVTSNTPETL